VTWQKRMLDFGVLVSVAAIMIYILYRGLAG
jgi:hypothetical protein